MAVTSAVSSRQTSQAMRYGLATGEKAASAAEVSTMARSVSASTARLAPGMSSSGEERADGKQERRHRQARQPEGPQQSIGIGECHSPRTRPVGPT